MPNPDKLEIPKIKCQCFKKNKYFCIILCNKNEALKDSGIIRRLKDISELPEKVKEHILYNLNATLRDYKAGQAHTYR